MTLSLYTGPYFLHSNSLIEFMNHTLFRSILCTLKTLFSIPSLDHAMFNIVYKLKNVFVCLGAFNNWVNNYRQYCTDTILN